MYQTRLIWFYYNDNPPPELSHITKFHSMVSEISAIQLHESMPITSFSTSNSSSHSSPHLECKLGEIIIEHLWCFWILNYNRNFSQMWLFHGKLFVCLRFCFLPQKMQVYKSNQIKCTSCYQKIRKQLHFKDNTPELSLPLPWPLHLPHLNPHPHPTFFREREREREREERKGTNYLSRPQKL